MAEAVFLHGDPRMVDHTPTAGDVAAGEVVVVGNTTRVAHLDIGNLTLGALAIGGGVYTVQGDAQINPGVRVYWDTTLNQITANSTARVQFGFTVGNCTAANATVPAFHQNG
jgi:predicted RecA/RadA family phage recombinase